MVAAKYLALVAKSVFWTVFLTEDNEFWQGMFQVALTGIEDLFCFF